jgi:ribosomal-protein-alanine N-acetyltransferase
MMEIIAMNEAHVAQVAALEKLCFSDAWSENSIRSELNNRLSLWLVAVDGDNVAGYIGSQTVLGWADMMNLCVSPEYRRRGIGEALTMELERRLRENRVEQLTLEVRVSNASAIALYEKLGFRQVGLRKKYYEKPREDALIMRKEWDK